MIKFGKSILLAGVVLTSQSAAQSMDENGVPNLGYCYWRDHYNGATRYYLTAVFQTKLSQTQTAAEWKEYTNEKYGPPPERTGSADCHVSDSDSISKSRPWHRETSPDGWSPSNASVSQEAQRISESQKKPELSSGALIGEDNGNAARAKAWDNVLLQAKREEATRKAAVAAATVESKAKYKQIMEKAIAEAKKRGNKQ